MGFVPLHHFSKTGWPWNIQQEAKILLKYRNAKGYVAIWIYVDVTSNKWIYYLRSTCSTVYLHWCGWRDQLVPPLIHLYTTSFRQTDWHAWECLLLRCQRQTHELGRSAGHSAEPRLLPQQSTTVRATVTVLKLTMCRGGRWVKPSDFYNWWPICQNPQWLVKTKSKLVTWLQQLVVASMTEPTVIGQNK